MWQNGKTLGNNAAHRAFHLPVELGQLSYPTERWSVPLAGSICKCPQVAGKEFLRLNIQKSAFINHVNPFLFEGFICILVHYIYNEPIHQRHENKYSPIFNYYPFFMGKHKPYCTKYGFKWWFWSALVSVYWIHRLSSSIQLSHGIDGRSLHLSGAIGWVG